MTRVKAATNDAPRVPFERALGVLLPLIFVGALVAVAALVAAAFGVHRDTALILAAFAGTATAISSNIVIYRQRADRRATARALRNVEARVGGIVESAMDAIVTVDERYRIVQFNAAAEKVFRWPRAAVLGQELDLLIPSRFRGTHAAHIESFARTATTSRGMGSQTVLYGLRADGQEFPIEASISQHSESGARLFTVILRDVTERIHAQQGLEQSESRLRGILDSAMDAIITVDDRQHIVIFNRAAEHVFRCPREDAIGAPLAWFIPERFRSSHHDLVRGFGESEAASRRMGHARVVMGLRRDGEEFPIEASISQVQEQGRRFFTVILRDVTQRVRSEEDLRRSRDEIRALALAASAAQEHEKSRVARELHDELGQALTALKIDVARLRDRVPGDGELREKLSGMQLVLDGTVAATRRIAADLRPLVLDDLGLPAAADWLVHNFTTRTGVPCELVMGSAGLELRDPVATAVFRALQESLTNVAKHAQASQVEVVLERDGGDVVLSVSDDGRGFSMQATVPAGSFGLHGLRERAALVSGGVRIESAPGRGTRIELRVPVPAEEAPA